MFCAYTGYIAQQPSRLAIAKYVFNVMLFSALLLTLAKI
ncbi:hypothetical protein L291_1145 [Acinetobacter guillouiae MSP4-18]|nr:hypothetical protein L291_1145 [Acinetobacter guillouiae MSP4-18]